MAAEQRPLFSFGCIADAQYADLEDGDTEGRSQLYRQVPGKLRAALAELRAARPRVQLVLHLGDIVNGNAAGQAQCDREFDLVASIFDQELVRRRGSAGRALKDGWALKEAAWNAARPHLDLQGGDVPALHVVGNHCLSVPREVLVKRLGIPETCYYSRRWGRHALQAPAACHPHAAMPQQGCTLATHRGAATPPWLAAWAAAGVWLCWTPQRCRGTRATRPAHGSTGRRRCRALGCGSWACPAGGRPCLRAWPDSALSAACVRHAALTRAVPLSAAAGVPGLAPHVG